MLRRVPPALAGKAADEPEIARWVARNIDNAAASPEDCPDAFAWTLPRVCRESPAFALMFVKDVWTKLLISEVRKGSSNTNGEHLARRQRGETHLGADFLVSRFALWGLSWRFCSRELETRVFEG